MNTNRKTATIVGVLFIIGTGAGVLLGILLMPILQDPDYLINMSANKNRVATATLLQFIMAFACAGIGISLYPILKKHNEGLALGSAGFRIMEGVNGIVAATCLMLLLTLSQEFVKAGTSQASNFQTLGVLLKAAYDWVNNVPLLLTWYISALMYYSIFYKTKLLPRWLSGWGLVGIALSTIYCMLIMFGVTSSSDTAASGLNAPIFLQEMVMAVWLIAKGFNPSAIASRAVQPM